LEPSPVARTLRRLLALARARGQQSLRDRHLRPQNCDGMLHTGSATTRCPSATAVSACGDLDRWRSWGDWHACEHVHVFRVRQLMSARCSAALPGLPCKSADQYRTAMPNPDEGIAQPKFYCGIPRCSPCFAMMLQILAVKSALCTGLPPRRLVGHGRPKTCLLNACTCEGTRARPGFSNSNAGSTYTPCAWRKKDRASSLQKLNNRPPGQVPSGGIYALDAARH